MKNNDYILLINGETRKIERRTRDIITHPSEHHLIHLRVTKEIWKNWRKEDVIHPIDLPEPYRAKYLNALL